MKTFFLYKTTNTVNGHYYIGVHGTTRLNDNYLGSGTQLKRAIKKYGRSVFVREILETFNTADEAYARELEVVNSNLVRDPNCYNLTRGGRGGTQILHGRPKSEEHRRKISEALSGRVMSEENRAKLRHPKYRSTYIKSEEHLQHISEALKGHKCSESVKIAISKARKGKIWIISKNGEGHKKLIDPDKFSEFEQKGYVKFRKNS